MAGNIFGKLITLQTFGESHGKAIGAILDGIPPGLKVRAEDIQEKMDRRRPGQSRLTTSRSEPDQVEILSGIYDGRTTGMPIGLMIFNKDARSVDYDHLKTVFRPSHADYTYAKKYGLRDPAGGGRSSARETAMRVAASYFTDLLLSQHGIEMRAYVNSVKNLSLPPDFTIRDQWNQPENEARCPDPKLAKAISEMIEQAKEEGDTLGGTIRCEVFNCPPGLGEPVFDKLQADLACAMLSINACKGFDYGSGFEGTMLMGSEHNDEFTTEKDRTVSTRTNFSGGIQGGISNGMPIYFKLAFKPVSTLQKKQQTIDTEGQAAELEAKGRHDPCVLPRAVPIVEAMTSLVLADHLLRYKVLAKQK
jgi:chorismate synthase